MNYTYEKEEPIEEKKEIPHSKSAENTEFKVIDKLGFNPFPDDKL